MTLFKISTIILITTNLINFSQSLLEIQSLAEDPILILETKKCKIQIGVMKIIHPINITVIRETIFNLNSVLSKLDRNLSTFSLAEHKINELHANFQQIQPTTHNRNKRWDKIGTAFKWLAGTPDAEDLRIINSSLNQLIDENNQQIKVNEQINKRLIKLTNAVNQIIEGAHDNRLFNEIEAIKTIINVNLLNNIIENIQDAILGTKIGLPSSKILSIEELQNIRQLLTTQDISINLLDEVLKYVVPKVIVKEDHLLYLLEIPQMEPDISSVLSINPLINNGQVIVKLPKYIVKSKNKLFVTSAPTKYVQQFDDLLEFNDSCIQPIIIGKSSHCKVKETEETMIKMVSNNKILVSNAKGELLHTNCGPDDRKLQGNILITFENCTIEVNDTKFISGEMTSKVHQFQGALYNLQMDLQREKQLTTISPFVMQNRRMMKEIALKQYNHQIFLWSMFGGLTLTGTVTMTLYISKGKGLINLLRRKSVKTTNTTTEPPSFSFKELLQKIDQPEDVPSTTPGGVTYMPRTLTPVSNSKC